MQSKIYNFPELTVKFNLFLLTHTDAFPIVHVSLSQYSIRCIRPRASLKINLRVSVILEIQWGKDKEEGLCQETRVKAHAQLPTYLGNQKSQHSTMIGINTSSSSGDGRSSKHIFVMFIKTDSKFQKLAQRQAWGPLLVYYYLWSL